MDVENLDVTFSDFVSTLHRRPYPAISPTRPELNQAGKTVLITGGGTGIGKAIARGFTRASAARIILVARQVDRLQSAAAELSKLAQEIHSPSQFTTRGCDVTEAAQVNALWDDLAKQGIHVDVLALNAAKFTDAKPLFDLGVDEVWSQFETNVKGPLHLSERFYKQGGEGQKFLLNVSTAAIHVLDNPIVASRPAYSLTKATGTLAVQFLANDITPDKMQVVSFHPGMIFGLGFEAAGFTRDMLPYDDENLPGEFAVWAASKEAEFLHGRFVWASWDIDELAKGGTKKTIEENSDYLRVALVGLKGSNRA